MGKYESQRGVTKQQQKANYYLELKQSHGGNVQNVDHF